jgi:hypothetical protein
MQASFSHAASCAVEGALVALNAYHFSRRTN